MSEQPPVPDNYVYRQNGDVHSYTGFARGLLSNKVYAFPSVSVADHDALIAELRARWPTKAAIEKMRRRYVPQLQGYVDPELGVNVTGLLSAVWGLVKATNEESMYRLFGELLDDIGETCVQGDSHRLLFFYDSLSASLESSRPDEQAKARILPESAASTFIAGHAGAFPEPTATGSPADPSTPTNAGSPTDAGTRPLADCPP